MADTTQQSDALAHTAAPSRHPKGLPTLFFTEMWERFSYYGMRALLMLFMVAAIQKEGLGFSEHVAGAIYGLYTAAVYLAALPGGWIADRLLGAQRSVWYGGIIIAAGHFTLAIPATETFFLGLVLVVIGTGLLKPNVSAIVGELYPQGDTRRDAGFTIFYMGINLGAFIGPLVCGLLGENVNWHYGFGAAGVGMVLGLTQYRLMRRRLGKAGLHPSRRVRAGDGGIDKGWYVVAAGFCAIALLVVLGVTRVITFEPVFFAEFAKYIIVDLGIAYFALIFLFGNLTGPEKKRCVVLIVLLVASAMFWSGFEQAGSSLNLFAKRHTDRVIDGLQIQLPAWLQGEGEGKETSAADAQEPAVTDAQDAPVSGQTASGFTVPASWFQSLNPIYIIVFAPFFASLWVALGRRNLDPSLPAKFAFGLILLGMGFLVMWGAAKLVVANDQARVLPYWLIFTYLLHTFGELCLSPVGLSAVTKLAPRRFVGQMMGLWFLATALGNLIAGLIAGEFSKEAVADMPAIFLRIVLTVVGTGVVLLILARPLKKLMGDIK